MGMSLTLATKHPSRESPYSRMFPTSMHRLSAFTRVLSSCMNSIAELYTKLVPINLPSQTNRRCTIRQPIPRRNQSRDIETILSHTVTSQCDWEGLTGHPVGSSIIFHIVQFLDSGRVPSFTLTRNALSLACCIKKWT